MEPLYRNRCVYTRAHLTQMARQSRPTVYPILCLCMLICGAVLCIATVWLHNPLYPLCGALLIAYTAFLYFYTPSLGAKKIHSQHLSVHKTEIVTDVTFDTDGFHFRNEQTAGKTDMTYDQVKELRHTRDLYIVVLNERLLVLLDKQGFSLGDAAAFPAFLAEKAPHAKIRY